MLSSDQIAHDLAMVYLVNRYGAEVSGDFDVETSYGDDREVSGSGSVETERLPNVGATRTTRVGTGERYFFKLFEKTKEVDTGEFLVDSVFVQMINDYREAHARFLELLTRG